MFVTFFCSCIVFIVKYVGQCCGFNIFWVFPVPWNILADLLRNTCLLSRVQKVMVCDFVIGGFQSVLFVSAFTKMIDWTEKPKIPSKFAICAVQYNKFCCKPLLVFLYLHLSCFELSMKQLSVFSTLLLGQAQVAMKIKTELNTGNNILYYMWRND